MIDGKENVRFTASAAYLRVGNASPTAGLPVTKGKRRTIVDARILSRRPGTLHDDVARFRQFALALPGAAEICHMGAADFRRNGRIFATLGR